jgi:hypothetical protein
MTEPFDLDAKLAEMGVRFGAFRPIALSKAELDSLIASAQSQARQGWVHELEQDEGLRLVRWNAPDGYCILTREQHSYELEATARAARQEQREKDVEELDCLVEHRGGHVRDYYDALEEAIAAIRGQE